MASWRALASAAAAAGLLAGCDGPRSALDPAGPQAAAIAELFYIMTAAGAAIWLAVIGGYLYARRRGRRPWSDEAGGRLILWCGAILPSALLLVLLTYALWLMPGLRPLATAETPRLRIEVTGHQYWWEVVYHAPDGRAVVGANEVRMPAGERVEFVLESQDVIHSFWIPPLGGKMDMIPGRTNRLTLLADAPGTFIGNCAEYCGTSHALMALAAVAMEPAGFDAWLAEHAEPSAGVDGEGQAAFLANGCGACHTVLGTPARGRIGPDLSHVGSRWSLAAGTLPVTADSIARFVANPGAVKPGANMPAYGMLPEDELQAIATWLAGLT
jgi:cytochrome c oxidase subunit 2